MNAPGWYPDPTAPGQLRWWDGATWTEQTAPAPTTAATTAPAPGPGAAPGAPALPPPLGTTPNAGPIPNAGLIPNAGPAPAAPATASRRGFVVGAVVLVVLVLLALAGGAFAWSKRDTGTAAPPTSVAPSSTPTTKAGGTTSSSAKDTPSTTERSSTKPAGADAPLSTRAKAAGIPLLDKEAFATHTHTLVKISVDGESSPIPANVGIDQRNGKIAAVHTHDKSGVVHVESPSEDDAFTIGQFLTLWGKGGDDQAVCESFVQADCAVDIEVVDPTSEDLDTFSDFGDMPTTAQEPRNGFETKLAQGAVIEVRITTK